MLRPPLRFRPAMLSPSGKHSLSSGFPHTMHHEETVRDEKDEKCRRSQEFAVKSENAERKGERTMTDARLITNVFQKSKRLTRRGMPCIVYPGSQGFQISGHPSDITLHITRFMDGCIKA